MIEPIHIDTLKRQLGDSENPKNGYFDVVYKDTINNLIAEGRNFLILSIDVHIEQYTYFTIFIEVDPRKKKGVEDNE